MKMIKMELNKKDIQWIEFVISNAENSVKDLFDNFDKEYGYSMPQRRGVRIILSRELIPLLWEC